MGDLSSEDRAYEGGALGEAGRGGIVSALLVGTEDDELRRGKASLRELSAILWCGYELSNRSRVNLSLLFPSLSLVPEYHPNMGPNDRKPQHGASTPVHHTRDRGLQSKQDHVTSVLTQATKTQGPMIRHHHACKLQTSTRKKRLPSASESLVKGSDKTWV
jgi:hypothetical protein